MTPPLRPEFIQRIKDEEGFSANAYWDLKQWSFGFGCRAPGQHSTITEERATELLVEELEEAQLDYSVVFQSDPPGLTQARYESLVDMLFNIGLTSFAHFHYTIAAIRAGNWEGAAAHAQQSLWYRQVGRRARRVIRELRTGVEDGRV